MEARISNTELVFIEEMHKKLDADYNEFKNYQKLVLETLSEFHRVCEKNNIKYYAAYGTLLGIIRDNGQIPWDYDIDVWVMLDDMQRLLDALEKDLSEKYHYACRFSKKNCRHFMLRVSPKGFETEVLHVDVFWLFGQPEIHKDASHMFKLYRKRRVLGNLLFLPEKFLFYKVGRSKRIILKAKKYIASTLPKCLIDNLYFRAVKYANPNAKMLTDEYGECCLEKILFENRELKTLANGMQIYVPAGYIKILENLYGNWQTILPIENRIEEYKFTLNRIRDIGKISID